ncbi:hypothetical protein GTY41_29400 [Streptomyces sp. SID685]|uniref:hypothetical protein n=1 Tax=Streptomyces sp. SID685 TaxID=2690322 RepID=UPI00136F4126|nr:hypothetical protein [Streptomyces sp. SID685]MYR88922.1 hypothetical protein [Streptomyces sp. SID685]
MGTAIAFAETPRYCDHEVCLENGTRFGAPASAFPQQSEPGAVSASQFVNDCAKARLGQMSDVDCGFYPYGDPQAIGYGSWAPLTKDYANCYGGNDANNLDWGATSTYSTSNSVTVGATVKAGLDELIEATLSTSYTATWGTAEGTTEHFAAFVPKGYKAHLQHRYQQQQVKGVLWINYDKTGNKDGQGYGHHYYAITDFTSTSPVKNEDGTVDDVVSLSPLVALAPGECS